MNENETIVSEESDDDLAVAIDALERFLKLPPEVRDQVLKKMHEMSDT